MSVAAAYLLNPLTLLTCLGRPTSVFAIFFVILSVREACRARSVTSAFALALASYVSLHPVLLLPPVGLLCYDRVCLPATEAAGRGGDGETKGKKVAIDQRSQPSGLGFGLIYLATFVFSVAFLFVLSRLLLPSWNFIPSVYLTPLTLPDLTPNPGLWW